MILKTPAGDKVHHYSKSIVVCFSGKRKVLSTGPLNAGYREDLNTIFNHDANPGEGMACTLKAPTYEEHMMIIAEDLGIDSNKTTGISTAASMNNVSIKTMSYEGLDVTAIITAGVETNGGRAGDIASFDERKKNLKHKEGTINIILEINANLTEGAVARALVTSTEAKTAALQELMADSRYSSGLATGSGTDGTIIVSNMESDIHLTNAGKHSKLGELIGKAVKLGVKEALLKQSGLSPKFQHSILRRWRRYGLTEESLWERYCEIHIGEGIDKPTFIHNLHVIDKDNTIVTLSSLYIHLLDQLEWNLLSKDEVKESAEFILSKLREVLKLSEKNVAIDYNKNSLMDLIKSFEKEIVMSVGGIKDA